MFIYVIIIIGYFDENSKGFLSKCTKPRKWLLTGLCEKFNLIQKKKI